LIFYNDKKLDLFEKLEQIDHCFMKIENSKDFTFNFGLAFDINNDTLHKTFFVSLAMLLFVRKNILSHHFIT